MPAANAPVLTSVPASPAAPALEEDPVPADVRAVIELFTSHLAKVAFPDVDLATLKRLADELRAEAQGVQRAREALDTAVRAADVRTATLTAAATRAIAYAQIYGEAQPERQAIVAALASLARPAPAAPPLTKNGKRRGRPPRQSAELFDAASPTPGAAPAALASADTLGTDAVRA